MTGLKLGIGVSCYNGPYRVNDLLESIKQNTEYPQENYRIVVIDDGSREENLITLRDICQKYGVSLREHRQNLGISATWNHLVRFFGEGDTPRTEYNILINDDIVCTPYWLTSLMYFLENNRCGTAGLPLLFGSPHDDKAVIMRPDQPRNVNAGPDVTSMKPGRVMAAPGCLFGFKRSLYDEIGGFDEHYKSFYEEIDFGTECAKRGYPSYALSWPRVWHMWGATFAQNPELEASRRMSESRAYYIQKWGGDHTVTNPRYMSDILYQKIRWFMPHSPGYLEDSDG